MKVKLLDFLRTLEKSEWVEFRLYLLKEASKSRKILRLFELIYHKRNGALDKAYLEHIYAQEFQELSRKSFYNLLSKIHLFLDDWLALQEYQADDFRRKLYRIKSFNKRGLYREADKLFYKLEKHLGSRKAQDLNVQSNLYELYQTQFLSTNPIKNKLGTKIIKDWYDAHSIGHKERSLQLISILSNWGQIKNINYSPNINLLKNSIDSLESSQLSLLLESLELMIAEDNVDAYHQLKKILIEESILDKQSLIHSVVLSFLQVRFGRFWDKRLITDGKVFYDITEYFLTYEIKKKNGKVGRRTFTNMFQFIAMTSEYEVANEFQNKWISYVSDIEKEDFVMLLKATNLFYNERYGELLTHLPLIKAGSISERILLLRLELGALYKLRKEIPDVLFGKILNFKRFLNRNKAEISNRLMLATKNYIRIFEKLNSPDFEVSNLDLSQYQFLAMRNWIEKQIKE